MTSFQSTNIRIEDTRQQLDQYICESTSLPLILINLQDGFSFLIDLVNPLINVSQPSGLVF